MSWQLLEIPLQVKSTTIPEIVLIKPKKYDDPRGFFAETYSRRKYLEFGIDVEFVQDNHSISKKVSTLRGLHFQAPPYAQAKLVRCGRGAIFDVAVDIRRGSPNYGQWDGYELTAENGYQLFVPVGFAHGFVTLEPNSEIVYKCSDYYAPEAGAGPGMTQKLQLNGQQLLISLSDKILCTVAGRSW